MEAKTDKVRALVEQGDYQKALSIARTFRIWKSKEDRLAVQLASEIKGNASFYSQLGKDVQSEFQKGVDVLIRYYGR